MSSPICIEATNLSLAWFEAMRAIIAVPGGEIEPLVVTITNLQDGAPQEHMAVSQILDAALLRDGLATCETVAGTIFPRSMWNPGVDRNTLYERYLRALPRIKRSSRQNQYGTYFERLIAFGDHKCNQLEYIIQTFQGGNHRRSALQASIFNPLRDQTHQRRRGFPCLQQVAFAPNAERRELAITGFYATQELYERAYGNYLGLCRLGQFVACQLNLKLTRMTCVASLAITGDMTKSSANLLLQQMGVSSLDANPEE